jgi:hypothetical protein
VLAAVSVLVVVLEVSVELLELLLPQAARDSAITSASTMARYFFMLLFSFSFGKFRKKQLFHNNCYPILRVYPIMKLPCPSISQVKSVRFRRKDNVLFVEYVKCVCR